MVPATWKERADRNIGVDHCVDERLGIARIDIERLSVTHDRQAGVALRLVGVPQIVVGLEQIGLELDRTLEADDRIFRKLQCAVRFAKVVEREGVIRVEPQRLTDEIDRLGCVAALECDDAEQVKRVGIRGIVLEQAAVNRFGIRKPARLMMGDRGVDERGHEAVA